MLMISAAAGIATYRYFATTPQSGVTVGLLVTVHNSKGQLINNDTRYMPHDLILNTFNEWLINLIAVGDGISTISQPITYMGDLSSYATSCAGTSCDWVNDCISPYYCGLSFAIGTGTVSPARTDTSLTTGYTPTSGSLYFPDTATNSAVCDTTTSITVTCNGAIVNTGASDTITGMSGSQSITSTATITEAGAFITGVSQNNRATTMIFHDTFTGIPVVSGDTVTVSYTLNLPSGITTNLANIIAAYLAGNLAGYANSNGPQSGTGETQVSISLTSTTDVVNTFYSWSNSNGGTTGGTYYPTNQNTASATNIGYMGIGTGTTAYTPSDIKMGTQIGSLNEFTSIAYTSTTASAVQYVTSTFTESTSNTITEAAGFQQMTQGGTSLDYMLFGTTFTSQTETAGTPYGISMNIGD